MKIKKMVVKNVKSFKNETTFEFNSDFNIFVGPNGCGKSNLLDIITVVTHYYFLTSYRVDENTNTNKVKLKNIHPNNFSNTYLQTNLEKFYNDNSTQIIEITFIISKDDISNLSILKNRWQDLKNINTKYFNTNYFSFDSMNEWDINSFEENMTISYRIEDHVLENIQLNKEKNVFHTYLKYYNSFAILSNYSNDITLHSPVLFFSPFRIESTENLEVNLSSEKFYTIKQSIDIATTKDVASLIKLASLHFSLKRREFECSEKAKHVTLWKKDKEVISVSKKLDKVGYDWDIVVKDKLKNIYEIKLFKNMKEMMINQSSSGEKELLNFILGIYAMNIYNGLIIIDEPELHLHPRWQKVLLELFADIAYERGIQFIFATHSASFIDRKSLKYISRIFKDNEDTSQKVDIENYTSSDKDILHIINATNNEKIFFSDFVFLVEGITDRLIYSAIINDIIFDKNINKIIDVIEVGGTGKVKMFREFLDKIKLSNFLIADLDYLNQCGTSRIKEMFQVNYKKINNDVIINKKSKDGETLAKNLEKAIKENDTKELEKFWEYMISFRKEMIIHQDNEKEVVNFIENRFLSNRELILQKGAIEEYFLDEFKDKKLENVLELLKQENYDKWKNEASYKELYNKIEKAISISNF